MEYPCVARLGARPYASPFPRSISRPEHLFAHIDRARRPSHRPFPTPAPCPSRHGLRLWAHLHRHRDRPRPRPHTNHGFDATASGPRDLLSCLLGSPFSRGGTAHAPLSHLSRLGPLQRPVSPRARCSRAPRSQQRSTIPQSSLCARAPLPTQRQAVTTGGLFLRLSQLQPLPATTGQLRRPTLAPLTRFSLVSIRPRPVAWVQVRRRLHDQRSPRWRRRARRKLGLEGTDVPTPTGRRRSMEAGLNGPRTSDHHRTTYTRATTYSTVCARARHDDGWLARGGLGTVENLEIRGGE